MCSKLAGFGVILCRNTLVRGPLEAVFSKEDFFEKGWLKMGSVVGRVKIELGSFLGSTLGVEYDCNVRFLRLDGIVLQIGRFWRDFA